MPDRVSVAVSAYNRRLSAVYLVNQADKVWDVAVREITAPDGYLIDNDDWVFTQTHFSKMPVGIIQKITSRRSYLSHANSPRVFRQI